jgi:hypothetical protein
MKKAITLSAFTVFALIGKAQITLNNSYFPEMGDSLVTANAIPNHVATVRITPASSVAQTWDFGYLRSGNNNNARNTERFRAINATTDTAILRQFPAANLVTTDTTEAIQVYRRTATRFELLGVFLRELGNIPLSIPAPFEPASLERRAPLAFNSTNTNRTGFNLTFSTSILPDSIRQLLTFATDSFRIRFQTTRQDRVDAFGKISIGGLQNVDCLRERRYEISESKIELQVPRTPFWIDVTNLVFNGNRPPRDTTIEYNFWATNHKEPLVSISSDNDVTATAVRFKWLLIRTSTQNTEGGIFDFKIYPSPAHAMVNLEITKMDKPQIVHVFDVLGKPIHVQKIENQILSLDVSGWANGFYVVKIGNSVKTFVVSR